MFLFQWTANWDTGVDGHLAQKHVDGELRFQQGILRNIHKMVEDFVAGKPEIGIATQILAQV